MSNETAPRAAAVSDPRGHDGTLVSVDGTGGAGKTTVCGVVVDLLRATGHAAHRAAQPSTGPLGRAARSDTDQFGPHALACLVAADRYWQQDTELRPARGRGEIVICDRYVPSSYVLQRMDGVDLAIIEALNAAVDRPDLSIVLDVDPDIAHARVRVRGSHSRFESDLLAARQEHRLLHDSVRRLEAVGWKFMILDANHATPQELAAQVVADIHALGPAGQPGAPSPI